MAKKEIKKLSLLRRPWRAKKILEVGGGHAPYYGITHAVDKYPGETNHRAHAHHVQEGVVFRQGDLENIPFDEKFDFFYASHVFEHVTNPEKAVAEINRLTHKGYIETPSPLWEQLQGPAVFDPEDIHKLYVWNQGSQQLFAIRKTAQTLGTFCDCANGKFVKNLCEVQKQKNISLEPYLTSGARTTKLFFTAPIQFRLFQSFQEACSAGFCAYAPSASVLRSKLKSPLATSFSKRIRKLQQLMIISMANK